MTSLLTNASAMTALQTLSLTNKNLATTQNRIATGERVSQASDNAAYWSIATGMRAQNGALSAVKDSMGFGAAVVDTAYTALEEAIKKTEDIFKKYVSLEQGGVDQAAVNAEIDQLKEQVVAIATNADFEGQNLLKDGGANLKVVTGFVKGSTSTPVASQPTVTADNSGATNVANGSSITSTVTGLDTVDLKKGQSFTFTVGAKNYTISASSTADMNNASFIGAMQDALAKDGIALVAGTAAGDYDLVKTSTGTGDSVAFNFGSQIATAGGIQSLEIDAFNLETSLDSVSSAATAEAALTSMRAAAAEMGAAKMRIDSQMDFTSKLMDAVDRGIGVLVDADMNAESARLSALQVQQQLGIQALSIANQNSQSILSLFR